VLGAELVRAFGVAAQDGGEFGILGRVESVEAALADKPAGSDHSPAHWCSVISLTATSASIDSARWRETLAVLMPSGRLARSPLPNAGSNLGLTSQNRADTVALLLLCSPAFAFATSIE
jgi:hypothetical protein